MRSDWRIFLADAGAEFEDDVRVASFGNPEREKQITITGNIFCDLSHWGLIAAYGEDAETFLQSQFGNDVSLVDEGHSQLSSLCTLKGRMFANFRLFKRGMTYYLRLPQALVEPTIKRLRMYVLRSRVTLENTDDTLIRIGCSGSDIESELARAIHGKALPDIANQVVNTPDYSLTRVAGVHPRFEIYGELEPTQEIWERLNVHAAPVGADNWDLLDILAGIPNIDLKTSEMFVPQMANMDLIGGISFTKGCYPGQEIVARTHYLGSLKRRMYRFHCQATSPPLSGQEIVTKRGKEDQIVGYVVNASPYPNGGHEGLAVLRIDSVESRKALHLTSGEGPELSIQPPPYPLVMPKD